MDSKRFLLAGISAGIVILVVSMVVGILVQLAFPYNIFDLGGMRAQDDPVMALYFLHPWVLAFAMAFAYDKFGGAIQGDLTSKGTTFGIIMWILVSIPSAFLVYSSMNYPIGFTLQSVLGSLIYMPLSGLVIAKVMK